MVSNPFDNAKTRMQLQNELVRKGAGVVEYRNLFHCLVRTAQDEGILALQKGLPAAMAYNFSMQSIRLGTYSALVRNLAGEVRGARAVAVDVGSGFVGGMVGSAICSPLSLVKVRLQTQGARVGAGYAYKGMWDGLTCIFREGGMRGLYRGSWASIVRVSIGSAAQLTSYKESKHFLSASHLHGMSLVVGSAAISGLCVSIAMNPFDVVSTRIYNASHNKYVGVWDCLVKTTKTEGFLALWKGLSGQYSRIVPHTVLSFLLAELIGYDFHPNVKKT